MAVEIEIFGDEIICPIDFNNKIRNILGICCLFLPLKLKDNFAKNLLDRRCLNPNYKKWHPYFENCPKKHICKESWHNSNNCEIHNQDIRSSRASNSLKTISKDWIKFFIEQNKINQTIKFNMLFIELDKMDISKFGTSKIHENIYNRFFRTTIHYGVKSFFNNSKILVKNVYHDKGSMEKHKYFPYLNLHKLSDEIQRQIQFENKEIIFVDSDHKKYSSSKDINLYKASNIIQFVDLLLGLTSQCLFYLSDDPLKKEHASLIYPLVDRLIKKPRNYNSSWYYVNKQNISFFPKSKGEDFKAKFFDLDGNLIIDDLTKEFHKNKKLEMPFYGSKQQSLLQFF
ncbi:hypothetical protein J7J90_01720 [Candidatus Micrarchaeota archaeon]|nr:hypothetical protein [Candidatus Micrarchaeota archaeon]